MRRFLLILLLLCTLEVNASWVTNGFAPSVGLKSKDINVNFNPVQTPFLATNGQIIYSVQVGAKATNGILAPTWLVGGQYITTFGPVPDTIPILCPIDTNTYSLWQLWQFAVTNVPAITNFHVIIVQVTNQDGTIKVTNSTGPIVYIGGAVSGGGSGIPTLNGNGTNTTLTNSLLQNPTLSGTMTGSTGSSIAVSTVSNVLIQEFSNHITMNYLTDQVWLDFFHLTSTNSGTETADLEFDNGTLYLAGTETIGPSGNLVLTQLPSLGVLYVDGSQVTQEKAFTGTNGDYLSAANTWEHATTGSGTVTSVAMTGDGTVFNSSVTGSPVTTSGTLAPSLHTQSANTFLGGPTSGGASASTFRNLSVLDLLGFALPANSPGALSNNGSGTLSWVPVGGGSGSSTFSAQFASYNGTTNIDADAPVTNIVHYSSGNGGAMTFTYVGTQPTNTVVFTNTAGTIMAYMTTNGLFYTMNIQTGPNGSVTTSNVIGTNAIFSGALTAKTITATTGFFGTFVTTNINTNQLVWGRDTYDGAGTQTGFGQNMTNGSINFATNLYFWGSLSNSMCWSNFIGLLPNQVAFTRVIFYNTNFQNVLPTLSFASNNTLNITSHNWVNGYQPSAYTAGTVLLFYEMDVLGFISAGNVTNIIMELKPPTQSIVISDGSSVTAYGAAGLTNTGGGMTLTLNAISAQGLTSTGPLYIQAGGVGSTLHLGGSFGDGLTITSIGNAAKSPFVTVPLVVQSGLEFLPNQINYSGSASVYQIFTNRYSYNYGQITNGAGTLVSAAFNIYYTNNTGARANYALTFGFAMTSVAASEVRVFQFQTNGYTRIPLYDGYPAGIASTATNPIL